MVHMPMAGRKRKLSTVVSQKNCFALQHPDFPNFSSCDRFPRLNLSCLTLPWSFSRLEVSSLLWSDDCLHYYLAFVTKMLPATQPCEVHTASTGSWEEGERARAEAESKAHKIGTQQESTSIDSNTVTTSCIHFFCLSGSPTQSL